MRLSFDPPRFLYIGVDSGIQLPSSDARLVGKREKQKKSKSREEKGSV